MVFVRKFAAALFVACTLATGVAAAQDYPNRPITMIVGFPPGGVDDASARILQEPLQRALGQTIVIQNMGGAGGMIAADKAAKADPDGYTILLASTQFSVNVAFFNQLPFDPEKDFVGISELATSPNAFVVKANSPAKSIKDIVALARSNPDKFNVSTPALNTSLYIQVEVLKLREKLAKMQCIAFKGGGEAVQAILSGTVDMCSTALPPAAPHIQAGTLRCLAVTGESRWPEMPGVPTMIESGYPNFIFGTDTALLAPSKTPPEIRNWLETETVKVLSTPDMKERLYKAGFLVRPKGGQVAWDRLSNEIATFKDIIQKANIQKM